MALSCVVFWQVAEDFGGQQCPCLVKNGQKLGISDREASNTAGYRVFSSSTLHMLEKIPVFLETGCIAFLPVMAGFCRRGKLSNLPPCELLT
jgi:hypothetical protein